MRFATLFALAIAAITTTALPSPSAEEPSDKPLPVPSDEPTAPPEQYRDEPDGPTPVTPNATGDSLSPALSRFGGLTTIAIPSAAPWATSTPSALAIALGLKVMGVEWKRNEVYVKDCDVLEMITQPG
ncbi:uncharacterized protein PG998_008675 [Apiospora kogelbergensis]|uniref:uncharacterized protein n=1 Tax=Apiospora kogelbergensis TaxID=1337665 RepID=UPI00312E411D